MNEFDSTTQDTLDSLYNQAFAIAGEWNGDDPGVLEDRAHIANQIMDRLVDIKQLVSALEE